MSDNETLLVAAASSTGPKTVGAKKSASAKKTTDAGKIKKARAPAAHPSYAEMINRAIKDSMDRKGTSKMAILKYIFANFNVGHNVIQVNSHLCQALKRGVATKDLNRTSGTGVNGRFKLAEKKPAVAKKPAATKKPKIRVAMMTTNCNPKNAAKATTGATKPKKAPATKKTKPAAEKPKKAAAAKPAAKSAAKPAATTAVKKVAAKKVAKKATSPKKTPAAKPAATTAVKKVAVKKVAAKKVAKKATSPKKAPAAKPVKKAAKAAKA